MSDLAADHALTHYGHSANAARPFPRYIVWWGVLSFSLSAWAAIILAIARYS